MLEESNSLAVLYYFEVRGRVQPIRNLLFYLNVNFMEVYLEKDQTKDKLPEDIKNFLKGVKIERFALPILIYQKKLIYGRLPIMNYLCRKFNAEYLLGRDLQQRARVTETMELLSAKQYNLASEMFQFAEECYNKDEETIAKGKIVLFQKTMNDSGYIGQICQLLEKQNQGQGFVFETLTMFDFAFLETGHLMLGMFNSLSEKKKCVIGSLIKGLFSCGKKTNKNHLRFIKTIENYVNFMHKQPFYQKNFQYLQSYTIICPLFSKQKMQGLRKIWGYNMNFVAEAFLPEQVLKRFL